MQVACDYFHVAQVKGGYDRSRPLDRRLADIDADDPSGRADQLRQDRQHAEGAAAAIDRFQPCWTPSRRNAVRAISANCSDMRKSRRRS